MKSPTHAQARQWIEQAADGLLKPAQKKALAAHLKGCAECRAFAAELPELEHGISKALQSHWGRPGLSKAGERNLMKQLQDEFGKGEKSAKSGFPKLPLFLIGGLIVLTLGFIMFGRLKANAELPGQPTSTQTAASSPTASPTASSTATQTHTPAQVVLTAVPNQNANCREGNGGQFEVADTLIAGERYTPIGRGQDNAWVLFFGPTYGEKCWVYVPNLNLFINDALVQIADIDPSLLPFVPYPPTPTPTPTATFTPEPFTPQCSDGIDNDRDGFIDLRDAQCRSANDNDELNP